MMTGPTAALLVWVCLGAGYAAAVWRLAHQGDDGDSTASGQPDRGIVAAIGPGARHAVGEVSSAPVVSMEAARRIPHAALIQTPPLPLAPERGRVDAKTRGGLFEGRALR
jgi:hypothetical protein